LHKTFRPPTFRNIGSGVFLYKLKYKKPGRSRAFRFSGKQLGGGGKRCLPGD